VARQDFKRNRTSVPEAYDRLGSIIRAKNGVEDFRQIMLEALRGYAPAILVEHDGGGSLEGVALVDTDTSEVLGDGLHERFFEYLYRSGRMSP
jgi:hypothetical protein